MKKYLVTYTFSFNSEKELTREETIDEAQRIMESTYIEPSVDDISNEIDNDDPADPNGRFLSQFEEDQKNGN